MISTNNSKPRFRDREETKLAVMTTSNTKPRIPRPLPHQSGLATARVTRDVKGIVLTNTNYKEVVAAEKARTLGARISKLRKERKAVLAKAKTIKAGDKVTIPGLGPGIALRSDSGSSKAGSRKAGKKGA